MKRLIKHYRQGTLFQAIYFKINKYFSKGARPGKSTNSSGLPFQLKRETDAKIEVIKKILVEYNVKNVLDVGCNAGVITRALGKFGYFSVGIDKSIAIDMVKDPLLNACLGKVDLDLEVIDKLPRFDAVLLLSVHHQLIKIYGDEQAMQYVYQLANLSDKIFIIEFAARNSKYGEIKDSLFVDNIEHSVIEYANDWLNKALPQYCCEYVNKAAQVEKKEPYRFIFKCKVK